MCMMPLFILSFEHIDCVSLCIVSDPLCLLHAGAHSHFPLFHFTRLLFMFFLFYFPALDFTAS